MTKRVLVSCVYAGMSLAVSANADQGGASGIAEWVGRTERQMTMAASPSNDWPELLKRVRSGDAEAQKALVRRLWPQVAKRIQGLCPRREMVEDLAQEVFARVFAKLWQFRGGVFEAWVDRIARNVCYSALRKQRVRPEWTFTDLGDEAPVDLAAPGDDLATVDAAEVLAELFRMLPDEAAWLLREVELRERAIGEVAREMGWTHAAARLRLFRARKKLKAVFEQWNR